jgi:DNA-binding response OmpR family regulator
MSTASRVRLALAEDDGGLREAVAEALREDGSEVLEAVDGSGLINIMRQGGIAAVVTDLMMPGLRGDDVLRLYRAAGDHTPFIVITAASTPIVDSVLMTSKVTVLRKPFTLESLIAAVHDVVPLLDEAPHPTPAPHAPTDPVTIAVAIASSSRTDDDPSRG